MTYKGGVQSRDGTSAQRGARATPEARTSRGSDGALKGAPVTRVIILANLAVFAGEIIASRSLQSLMSVPAQVWLAFGANYAPLTLALGQYDRLVASCFVHGSLLHVGLNLWSLRQIGPFVERTVGSARYPVLYVVTGIAGSVASVLWGLVSGHIVPSVGASGAICGVMGAALVLGVRLEGWRSGIARQIGFWLLIIVAYGASVQGIDNAAHVGGMVSGCLIATAWRRGVHYSKLATLLSIGVSAAVCVAAGAAVVWRDVTDPFALKGPNDRSDLVVSALLDHDCAGARRALVATEEVSPPTPNLVGLRKQVDQQCPPGAR
jgi:rhomboid protease GluP